MKKAGEVQGTMSWGGTSGTGAKPDKGNTINSTG